MTVEMFMQWKKSRDRKSGEFAWLDIYWMISFIVELNWCLSIYLKSEPCLLNSRKLIHCREKQRREEGRELLGGVCGWQHAWRGRVRILLECWLVWIFVLPIFPIFSFLSFAKYYKIAATKISTKLMTTVHTEQQINTPCSFVFTK